MAAASYRARTGYNCVPASGEVPALQATSVAGGITEPILVAHEPNACCWPAHGARTRGRIRIIENWLTRGHSFLDFSGKANSGSPGGVVATKAGRWGSPSTLTTPRMGSSTSTTDDELRRRRPCRRGVQGAQRSATLRIRTVLASC